jgi:hypothetical protein
VTEVEGARSHLAAPGGSPGRLRRPPRRLYHLLLLFPAGVLLYAASAPGGHFLLAVISLWFLGAFVIVWLVRLGLYVAAVHRGTHGGAHRWFLLAPIMAVGVVALVWADVPLRVRWLGSRSAFEQAVAMAPQPTDRSAWVPFEVGDRLGSYRIDQAVRAGDGVLFFEATGSFLDHAGFAYLPSGPFYELQLPLESPEFRSLGGGWYAWTASW